MSQAPFRDRPHAFGHQRDWIWRGWTIRYTYIRSQHSTQQPPLMLLHGFGASIGHWRHNLEEFSQQHTVYALDLLGYGASQKVVAPYGIALWMELVHDFWLTFIRQPVVLVGNSIGSSVALAAAAAHPEMAAGLVMMSLPDASVLDYPPVITQTLKLLGQGLGPVFALLKGIFTSPPVFHPLFAVLRWPRLVKVWALQAYANDAALTDDLVEIFARPAYEPGAARALRAMINAKPLPSDYASDGTADYTAKAVLPRLTLPMLLLWGKQDKFVPPTLAPLFVRCNPDLKLVELDAAGHCPHDECPDRVNTLILDWIADSQRLS
jgi:pimeloyl-ACP methyl ester carboxylesterase